MLPAVFLPLLALAACMVFQGRYFFLNARMETQLAAQEAKLLDQHVALLRLGRTIQGIEKGYAGIDELNKKLRVMLQREDEPWGQCTTMGMGSLGPMPLNAMLPFKKLLPARLHNQCELLEEDMLLSEIHQQELISAVAERKEYFEHMPSIWPTKGRFSSGFGNRKSPFTGKKEFHKGIDISSPRGTPVYAPAAGVVIYAKRFSTYGNVIDLDHGIGITTRYAHLHKIAVKLGQVVTRGELIGYVGNTGRSTASHLHYEVHVDDKLVNPRQYILN